MRKSLYYLIVLGETAGNLSPVFRQAHDELPWSKIIGISNRLVRAYFSVNIAIVWDTAQFDIPALAPLIESLLKETEANEFGPDY